MAKQQRKKSKLGLFVLIFIFSIIAIVIGFFLMNYLYPEWKSKIPKQFKEIIVENQTITQTEITNEVTNVYPSTWGFAKSAAVVLVTMLGVATILGILYFIVNKRNIFFKHNLKKCQKVMFDKIKNSPNSNIRFEDEIGTWGIPFTFFLKDDLRYEWAGCVFSLFKLGKNRPFNKFYSILATCSMNDPENKFFPFFGWVQPDLIEKFHLISQQSPWARLDAVKLDITMPFDLPDFQEGMRQGIQQRGKDMVVG